MLRDHMMLLPNSSIWEADTAGASLGESQGPIWGTSPPWEMPGYLPSCCRMESCQWRFSRSG